MASKKRAAVPDPVDQVWLAVIKAALAKRDLHVCTEAENQALNELKAYLNQTGCPGQPDPLLVLGRMRAALARREGKKHGK